MLNFFRDEGDSGGGDPGADSSSAADSTDQGTDADSKDSGADVDKGKAADSDSTTDWETTAKDLQTKFDRSQSELGEHKKQARLLSTDPDAFVQRIIKEHTGMDINIKYLDR